MLSSDIPHWQKNKKTAFVFFIDPLLFNHSHHLYSSFLKYLIYASFFQTVLLMIALYEILFEKETGLQNSQKFPAMSCKVCTFHEG